MFVCLWFVLSSVFLSRISYGTYASIVISEAYFLFPTIENMLTTVRGKEVLPLTSYLRLPLVWLLTFILAVLPSNFLQLYIFRCVLSVPDDREHVEDSEGKGGCALDFAPQDAPNVASDPYSGCATK